MPTTDIVGQVKRRKARDAGIHKALDTAILAEFPSRAFYGRVTIDIWNRDEFVSHTSYPQEPKKHLLEQDHLTLPSQDISTITGHWQGRDFQRDSRLQPDRLKARIHPFARLQYNNSSRPAGRLRSGIRSTAPRHGRYRDLGRERHGRQEGFCFIQ